MKNIYNILLLAGVLLFSACSDFLNREPLTAPNNVSFLSDQAQLENYINNLYTSLPAFAQFGMAMRGAESNSDNIILESYNARMNGELKAFDGSSTWTGGYAKLRNVNYFFRYYAVPPELETAAVLSLKGEAYFLRAYWHFSLLTSFGDIPIMDKFWDEQATIEGLQIPASNRTDVAKFILQDLQTASELLFDRSKGKGLRICKEAAQIFAMRVALYEGTWEKYHKGTDFYKGADNSNFFFEQVMAFGDEVFKSDLTLNTTQTDKTAKTAGDAFGHLFNTKNMSDIKEAVFWKKYDEATGVFHVLGSLLSGGQVNESSAGGLSQALVDNYLNADGTFIDPTLPKFKDFNETFKGRDSRLTEVVMNSGSKFKSNGKPLNVEPYPILVGEDYSEADSAIIKRISPPFLKGSGNGKNITGYHIRLGIDTTWVTGKSETAHVLIRYAEALLSYAEAAEELGKCTDAVLDKTLRLLRERAGVTYVKPSTIDPHFPDFGYPLTPNMQEIRRERRSEFALQDYRLDDLMRWRAHPIFKNKRGKGAYFGKESVLYRSFDPLAKDNETTIDKVLVDENNWMDPLKEFLPNGYQFDPGRDYLLPIPPEELMLNKTLKQNPGKW
ncbi:RagB/SusD family nutrient uptake outer membrane protein [Bacteroides neonati]|uniref:RagB/SusD family nutrient uptake outer membrane protein n=1 Tax=Bacteroides neonati TaxID=1347393 RepID=UPI0004B71859|nr:RagB/SusD family nutrient uptake outer membrane protein [Bacteroides neonati]MCP3895440.1 RagB/SusD family nutrient uptake outer membrane protein [Bacteroides sp.]